MTRWGRSKWPGWKTPTTSKVSRHVQGVGDKVQEKEECKSVRSCEQIRNPQQLAPRSATWRKGPHGTVDSGRAVQLEVEVDPADGVVVLEELRPPIGSGSGSGSGRSGPRPPPRRPPRSLGRSRLRDLSDLSTRSRTSEGSQTQMPCGWSAVLTKSKSSK